MADVGWGGLKYKPGAQQAADNARYGSIQDQATNRDISGQWNGGFDKSNATYGQAGAALDTDGRDAAEQNSGIAETMARANGTEPSQGIMAANQALDQSVQNQRTAAASSSGGAIAQASGLRSVSQGVAGQQAQAGLQNAATNANEQIAAQQAYAEQVGQAQRQNVSNDAARTSLAGMYAGNDIAQAGLSAGQRQNNQAQGLFGQKMGVAVNAEAQRGQQANADLAEKERQNRRAEKQNQNGFFSRVVGGVVKSLGTAAGMAASDERAKDKGWDIMGMDDPNTRIGEDGRGYIAQNEEQPSIAKHFGSSSSRPAKAKAPVQGQDRKMTDDELMAAADREIASVKADTARREAEGPALRYAGPGTKENGYNTQLTHGAEQAYQSKFGERSDQDYDLRGAFADRLTDGASTQRGPDGSSYLPNHLPDTYKKPNHETFSDESKYAPMAPGKAGHWQGDTFQPALGSMRDLVDPNMRKYQGPAVKTTPNGYAADEDMGYGDWEGNEDLAYNSKPRAALAYGGRRG